MSNWVLSQQAPALVFYNNKTFTDDDWRGIRSIYTSVKRDDPLKIGRFGLGFKSVFHLTGKKLRNNCTLQ